MSQRRYIPAVSVQARLAEALRAEKIARLTINGGRPGDEEVEVVLEHSPDYKISSCVDHYLVQVGSDGGFVIKKNFCSEAVPPQPPEVVEPEEKDRWHSLHPLFIPDTEVAQENPRWREALGSEISWDSANPRFDMLRRLLAQPSSDYLRKVLEETKTAATGQTFFQLLRPMEMRLAGVVNQETAAASVRKHIGSFMATATDPKLKATEQDLNLFLRLAFPEESLEKIRKKVRVVVFSEYPLLPEGQLEGATNKLTDWVCRRILWEAASEEAPSKPNLNPAKAMDAEQIRFFRSKLEEFFLNPETRSREVEELIMAFQMIAWGLQQETLKASDLFSGEAVSNFAAQVQRRFDEEIGMPVIKKLLDEKFSKLPEADQKRAAGRIESVFKEGELPMRWEVLNTAGLRDVDDLLGEIKVGERQMVDLSLNNSAVAAIDFAPPGNRQKHQLTAKGASLLVTDLKKWQKEGRATITEAGTKLADEIQYLESDTAREYLTKILALGEGEDVAIETQARHLLEIAILGDFAERSIWKSPWLWTAIGVGTGALAGAVIFLSGDEDVGARPGPAANGGGNGNGNGNGNGPGPLPIPDDGRGTPTTVGP